MIIYPIFFLFSVAFVELFVLLNVKSNIRSVIELSRKAVGVLMSSEIEDSEKEVLVRRSSMKLFIATFVFTAKFLSVFVIFYAVYFLIDQLSPELGTAVIDGFKSPTVLIILTVATMCYVWVRNVAVKKL